MEHRDIVLYYLGLDSHKHLYPGTESRWAARLIFKDAEGDLWSTYVTARGDVPETDPDKLLSVLSVDPGCHEDVIRHDDVSLGDDEEAYAALEQLRIDQGYENYWLDFWIVDLLWRELGKPGRDPGDIYAVLTMGQRAAEAMFVEGHERGVLRVADGISSGLRDVEQMQFPMIRTEHDPFDRAARRFYVWGREPVTTTPARLLEKSPYTSFKMLMESEGWDVNLRREMGRVEIRAKSPDGRTLEGVGPTFVKAMQDLALNIDAAQLVL